MSPRTHDLLREYFAIQLERQILSARERENERFLVKAINEESLSDILFLHDDTVFKLTIPITELGPLAAIIGE